MHISKTGGSTVHGFLRDRKRWNSRAVPLFNMHLPKSGTGGSTAQGDPWALGTIIRGWGPPPGMVSYEMPLRSLPHTEELCVWTSVREPSSWLQSALDHQRRHSNLSWAQSLYEHRGHMFRRDQYQTNWFVGAQMRSLRLEIYRTEELGSLIDRLGDVLELPCGAEDGKETCVQPRVNSHPHATLPVPKTLVAERYGWDARLYGCVPVGGRLVVSFSATGELTEASGRPECIEMLRGIMNRTSPIGPQHNCDELRANNRRCS